MTEFKWVVKGCYKEKVFLSDKIIFDIEKDLGLNYESVRFSN